MKRKILTISAMILLCVLMIGTGFAGWIISQDTQDSSTGNIKADGVTSNAYTMTDLTQTENALLYFGAPTTEMNAASAWLTNDVATGGQKESLSAEFSSTISKGGVALTGTASAEQDAAEVSITVDGTKITAKIEVSSGADAYKLAVDANLVTSPVVSDLSIESGVLTVTVSAGWGTHFGGNNPYTYYNALTDGSLTKVNGYDTTISSTPATKADVAASVDALYSLKCLEAFEDTVGFTLTVTVTGFGENA